MRYRVIRSAACGAALALAGLASADPGVERARYEYALHLAERAERERGYAPLALEELAAYLRRHDGGRFRDDARLRAARLELGLGRPRRAAARLLELRILDAGSSREGAGADELERLLASERDLRPLVPRYREALARYRDPAAEPAARRLALLRALLLVDDDAARERAREAGLALLEEEPLPAAADEVALALGELERRRGAGLRAVAAFERLPFLVPASPLVARALLLAGDVRARDLDDPRGALESYERVTRERPDSTEAATAWLRMGDVERQSLRRPKLALDCYRRVLERFPDHPDAFAAVLASAEALRAGLGDAEGAERALLDGVERYPGHARAPEALERAGEVAEREARARRRAAGHYRRLAGRYPGYSGSPAALFRAASLLEEEGEVEEAARLFRETAERFPASPEAGRAARRAERLAPARGEGTGS